MNLEHFRPLPVPPEMLSMFAMVPTDKPLVAIRGQRNGYIMLATHEEATRYEHLPASLFDAAQEWAATLEGLGALRAYWITLSEVTRHLHIHIFPRWDDDDTQGVALFETRNNAIQPAWEPEVLQSLSDWAAHYNVELA